MARDKGNKGLWDLHIQSPTDKNVVTHQARQAYNKSSASVTHIECIIVPRVRSKQTKNLNLRSSFRKSLQRQGTCLGNR